MKYLWVYLLVQICFILMRRTWCSDPIDTQCVTKLNGHNLCSCTPNCKYYGNCCALFLQNKALQDTSSDTSIPKSLPRPTCLSDITPDPALIWNRCPSSYTSRDSIRELCEVVTWKPHVNIPVYSIESKLLFRNYYCALCNGFKTSHLKISIEKPLRVQCQNEVMKGIPNSTYLNQLLQKKECRMQISLPTDVVQKCYPKLIYRCPNSNRNIAQEIACNDTPTWYTTCLDTSNQPQMVYHNPKCAICHNPQCSFGIPDPLKATTIPGQSKPGSHPQFFYDFDLLLNFKILDDFIKVESTPNLFTTPSNNIRINETNDNSFNNISFNTTNSDSIKVNQDTNSGSILAYVTPVCYILSLLALFILILVFSIYKDLRSANGTTVLILATTLFLALLLFTTAKAFQSISPLICRIVGGFCHFLYTSTFAWMSLNAFDLLRTFHKNSISTYTQSKCRTLVYCIFGFGLPALVSCGAQLFDVFIDLNGKEGSTKGSNFLSKLAPRFGAPICWFNSKWGLITWFFGPVALTIVFNTIVCVLLLRYFCRVYTKSSQAIRTRRYLLLVCVKMCTILGVTWGFNITTQFLPDGSVATIVLKIAGVLSSLQGLFIAFCFLANRRVVKTIQSSVTSSTSLTRSKSSNQTSRRASDLKYTPVKGTSYALTASDRGNYGQTKYGRTPTSDV